MTLTMIAALIVLAVAAPATAQTVPADIVRVIDGDTVVVDAHPWPGWTLRVSVRLAGIDAPEKRSRCAAEAAGAARAEARLVELLARGPLVLVDPVHGRFAGRVVPALRVGVLDLGQVLLDEGLARPYSGRGPRESWCG